MQSTISSQLAEVKTDCISRRYCIEEWLDNAENEVWKEKGAEQ